MRNKKFNKLISTFLAALGLVSSVSICAAAAQIDALSVIDNTVYASISDGDATLFVAEYNEGVLSDAFFADSSDGKVELKIGTAAEYKLFLWDRESLAPVSCTYNLINGKAYAEGSNEALPEHSAPTYSFNQEDNVTIIASVSETELKGFKAGEEISLPLADSVEVLGLSDSIEDITPGSVVLTATDASGNCAAIELLSTFGDPVSPDTFISHYGIYDASDGSTRYKNIVTRLVQKSGTEFKTVFDDSNVKYTYNFKSSKTPCYRIGITVENNISTVSCRALTAGDKISESTTYYYTYIYLRYDSLNEKVIEAVAYNVPKNLNFNPDEDDRYSPIFSYLPE